MWRILIQHPRAGKFHRRFCLQRDYSLRLSAFAFILLNMRQPPDADPRIAMLLESLDHAFDKASWHGPNLSGAIRGVNAALAARRLPGRKCLWEQTLHAAYWKRIVLNKLDRSERFPRAGSDWPKMPGQPTEQAWRDDVRLLYDMHAQLRAAVASMDPARLDDAKLRRMLHGAALHDIYHAGQMRLLRKMLMSKR
jgi:hypothetical protein